MTLYFKIDCMERLFLLYASELLIREGFSKQGKNGKEDAFTYIPQPKFTVPKEYRGFGSGAGVSAKQPTPSIKDINGAK